MAADDKGALNWVTSQLGLVPPVTDVVVAGGWSNITTIATDATGRSFVLRRPPAGAASGGAHDVIREAEIMHALRDTAVPVPGVLAICRDASVAGAPFYVMDRIDGVVVGSAAVAATVPAGQRRALGVGFVDLLAALQAVDIDAVGLGSLRRNTPYLERQLRRWQERWRQTATRAVPAVDLAATRLEQAVRALPAVPDVLTHGDFRLGNVIIDAPATPRIAALLDWELTTTGHPLADLGFVGARIQAPREALDGPDPSAVDGYPTFPELAAHYATRTGTDISALPVFVALSAWRWAIIVEGIANRLAGGVMTGGMGGGAADDPAWHRRRAEVLAEFAADVVASVATSG